MKLKIDIINRSQNERLSLAEALEDAFREGELYVPTMASRKAYDTAQRQGTLRERKAA